MKTSKRIWIPVLVVILLGLLVPATLLAQQTAAGAQVQTAAMAQAAATAAPTAQPTASADAEPLYMPRNVKNAYALGSRSPDGKPGPNYWQNTAVHDINVTVLPPSRTITVTEQITYTNNSRDYLGILPVRLYLNARLPEAQRERNVSPDFLTGGMPIDGFQVNGVAQPWEPQPGSGATYTVIKLPVPLAPGDSVNLSFTSHFDLALKAQNEGVIDPTTFFVAYFFPRISPANDTDGAGFDVEEFTYRAGRERFNDFADFTFSVNVPKNYVVWATGDLQNPQEVLQPAYAKRLKDSMTSDKVINIAQPDEMKKGLVTAQSDTVTWKWKASNVPEVAFGLSDHYVWDAGSVVVDPATKRRTSVQAAYPTEATDFKTMVEDSKDALVFGSTQWPGVPYPYSTAIAFVGGADEEFPMIINDAGEGEDLGGGLIASTRLIGAHELLHAWFPFYMGIDERRYPMLDEGWTTAFEYLYNLEDIGKDKADAIFKAMRSSRLVPPSANPGTDIPVITPADSTRGPVAGSNNAYEKPALAYLALKELMGDKAFKASLHEFIARWNGKHPLPWDMFNTFNATSGENLNWFFNNWFFSNNYPDLALAGVRLGKGETEVQVNNVGGFAMPFDVIVAYADGAQETFHQNPAIWKDSPDTATITVKTPKEVKMVALDGGIFMDAAPTDNVWPPQPATDPYAPVIDRLANADGTAAITMTLLPKSVASGPGQFTLPSGVTAALVVLPAGKTPEQVIKDNATSLKVSFKDSQIVDAEPIAGLPSKMLRSTVTLGQTTFAYDIYALSSNAANFAIILLGPPAAIEKLRSADYPKMLETVVVEPK
jgi:hypothetical protein